jgi:indolepyruvate ferredoxin oxidoreductase
LLRSLGLRRKVALGPAWLPVLRVLAHGRWLRGTWLDPFGHTNVRRAERQLLADYAALLAALTDELSAETYQTATEVAAAAELVRGYEHIKLAGIQRCYQRLGELGLSEHLPLH